MNLTYQEVMAIVGEQFCERAVRDKNIAILTQENNELRAKVQELENIVHESKASAEIREFPKGVIDEPSMAAE